MITLSNGMPSTFDSYLEIARARTHEGSHAVQFFEEKVRVHGRNHEVTVLEPMMLWLIEQLAKKDMP